jgi:hypothetical protein
MKVRFSLAVILMQVLFALPANAGAATGMPSPFLPPYPDYGLPTHCPCRDMARRTLSPRHDLTHQRDARFSETSPVRLRVRPAE